MAVKYGGSYDVNSSLMASVAVTATRGSYTIDESEVVNDVILLRKVPEGAEFVAVITAKGGAIDGDVVLARADGTVLTTLASGLGGAAQASGRATEECYLAVKVTTAPAVGDAGNTVSCTAFYQYGAP